jgi:hypothetical protein
MSNALSENIIYTTVAVYDDVGTRVGTGFLIGDTPATEDEYGRLRVTWETPSTRSYLVTARHVLGANASVISCTHEYQLRYNGLASEGFAAKTEPFVITNDPPNWAIHPDESVDVAVLDVTRWVLGIADGYFRFWPLSEIANAISLASVDCDAGDNVFVLGYPLTLRQGATNLPLVRQGVLATSPRRALVDPDTSTGLRGFLVDGAIMPGSSGSPVVSTSKRFVAGDLEMTPNRPLAVGMVAQEWGRGDLERYDASNRATNDIQVGSYANLGFVHSGSTIIETISQLRQHAAKSFLALDHDQHWAPQTGIPEWALEFAGPFIDAITMDRIQRRLHRDRIRALGKPVVFQEYHDAPDIMGEVPASPSNVKSHDEFFAKMRAPGQ